MKNDDALRIAKRINPDSPDLWRILTIVPTIYDDFKQKVNPLSTEDGEKRLFSGVISRINVRPLDNNPKVFQHQFTLKTPRHQEIGFSIFGRSRLFGSFGDLIEGSTTTIYGRVANFGERIFIKSPEVIHAHMLGIIRPKYPRIHGIAKDKVYAAIQSAVNQSCEVEAAARYVSDAIQVDLDKAIRVIRSMHTPDVISPNMHKWIEDKSAEAMVRQIIDKNKSDPKSIIEINESTLGDALKRVPFKMSASQAIAVQDICDNLKSDIPLNHLVSGDVGSGKTIVYGVIAVAVQKQGHSVAIMIPNTLLLAQVHKEIQKLSDHVVLIETGKKSKIDMSSNPIVMGTTSLISRFKGKHEFDLVIIDEQQKMSSEQRESICSPHTNVIQSTATCLPGTYGSVAFGAATASIVEPHVKKDIKSRLMMQNDRKEMFTILHERAAKRERIAIVYPELTGDGKTSIDNASVLWEKHFKDQTVVLHGGMKSADKTEALEKFRSGEKNILITTTVIEIGITIENFRTMLVVGAENFGMSTLHQLRGRIARDGGSGEFYMLHTGQAPEQDENEDGEVQESLAIERLRAMEIINDGAKIAEMDAKKRGIGNLNTTESQHGKTSGSVFYGIIIQPEAIKKHMEDERKKSDLNASLDLHSPSM